MFIQTEPTPNPATLKFIPGKTVLGDGTVDFRDKSEASASPLAQRLFGVDGVTGVFLGSDFISVTKTDDADWSLLKTHILGEIMQHLASGLVPLAPALIKRRLKQGKEDPARVGERRGLSQDVRPHGPLVWIHGASVGEVLAAAALIERLRDLNLRILLTSGTVTSAAVVAKRFPPDVIHQYVPYDSPRYVARFLEHLVKGLRLSRLVPCSPPAHTFASATSASLTADTDTS